LGNVTARILKLAEDYLTEQIEEPNIKGTYPVEHSRYLSDFRFDETLNSIWSEIQLLDQKITETEPFKLIKDDSTKERAIELIQELTTELYLIAHYIGPFLPETSEKILTAIKENKKPENLFPRLEK